MVIRWSLLAVPGLAAAVLAVALALFILRVDAARDQNRRVATLLAYLGAASFVAWGLGPLWTEARLGFAGSYLLALLALPIILAHGALLSHMDGAPARLLAYRGTRWVALGATGVLAAVCFARPDLVVADVVRVRSLDVWSAEPGPLGVVLVALMLITMAFAVWATFVGARRADDDTEAAQVQAFFLAYGVYAVLLALGVVLNEIALDRAGDPDASLLQYAAFVLPPFSMSAFVVLMWRATLVRQLFDARKQTRGFVSRGSVVAVFTFGIVVAGELLEQVLPISSVVLGIMIAVILGILLRPIQLVADRLARRLVPEDRDEGLAGYSEAEVFRSAILGAFGDGEINPKEARTLDTLRRQLGLEESTADRIRREVLEEMRERRSG